MKQLLFAIPIALLGFPFAALAQRPDVVPRGTEIQVRTNEYINSHHADGRVYTGTVVNEIRDRGGSIAIPRGTQVELIARDWGNGELVLDLNSIMADGRQFVVDATPEQFYGGQKPGVGGNERTGKFVGGGALLGTIVGAIAGGGHGAVAGAVGGAAVGAGAEMATRGREIRVPAETLLTFRLERGIHPDRGY